MGEAFRREAHGSRAAGPQVRGRGELEHRLGRWGPPSPPSPTRARDTTTRCKQRRLPRPPGGGGRLGSQPVGQWAKAGARPAHMPSPEARDGEEGAPKREGQEIGQTQRLLGAQGPLLNTSCSSGPLHHSVSLSPSHLLVLRPIPRPQTALDTHVGPSQAAELVLQVAGEVIGFLNGGAGPRVPCAIEGWHCREVPEHGAQTS